MARLFHPGESVGKETRSVSWSALRPFRVTRFCIPSITNISPDLRFFTSIPKMKKVDNAEVGLKVTQQGDWLFPSAITLLAGKAIFLSLPVWTAAKIKVTRL